MIEMADEGACRVNAKRVADSRSSAVGATAGGGGTRPGLRNCFRVQLELYTADIEAGLVGLWTIPPTDMSSQ